jgi:hypothetical protein
MHRRNLLLLATLGFAAAFAANAQLRRNFPADSLRGKLALDNPPLAVLNGAQARLAPGVRIRGQNNMLATTGAFAGQTFVVNYTIDTQGQIKDVWVLTNEELERLWPATREQAASWRFDPGTQTWAKP